MKPFLVVQASGRARVGDVVAASAPLRETNDCVCTRPGDGCVLYREALPATALARGGERDVRHFVRRCADERFGPLVVQFTGVLATIDPLSLVSRGAPQNEYEPEARTILLGLQGRNLRHVEQVIDAEFVHWFGKSMRLGPDQIRRIARGLVVLLPSRLRLSGHFLHRSLPASRNPASGRIGHVRARP